MFSKSDIRSLMHGNFLVVTLMLAWIRFWGALYEPYMSIYFRDIGGTYFQLGALLEQCDILVSGDTGPMHIATAVGTRVVALFGAADPERTGPVGSGHRIIQATDVSCIPCSSRTCNNRVYLECMEKIPVSLVFETIRDMLNKG